VPTPRGGGSALLLGCAVAVVAVSLPSSLRVVALAAAAYGVLGFAEDVKGIAIGHRMLVQAAIAVPASYSLLHDRWSGLALVGLIAAASLLLVSYVNAFNFMDGINGISATQCIVAGGALALVANHVHPVSATVREGGAIVAASALAFLPFNAPKATMFLGDVGSYFLGGWLALLVVAGVGAGLPLLAVLGPTAIYGIDTLSTIVRRIRRHESPTEPHRDHVYQRVSRKLKSHTAASAFVSVVTALAALLGALAGFSQGAARIGWLAALAVVVLAYAALGWLVDG
jgi:UDP-N-acetylmuramyl pentapeptide phosphotransferase/UDP-N-acetylglucosamine-1-phosphate transferase